MVQSPSGLGLFRCPVLLVILHQCSCSAAALGTEPGPVLQHSMLWVAAAATLAADEASPCLVRKLLVHHFTAVP